MLGYAGCFGEHGDVRIHQHQARRVHAGGHLAQEYAAVGTSVTRIGIGKVLADVAIAERAQDGIAKSMDHHVTVRMRHHALGISDFHAAQHDMIAFPEGVHIESLTNPHCRHRSALLRTLQDRLGHRQIFRPVSL